MLQRLINSFDFADELDGTWSREQLLEMDGRFTAAVERAFGLGLESRAAASATVRIGFRNGKDAAVEGAIEAGWRELCRNKGDISFLEIVQFVRERCPNIDQARIRSGFDRRFRQRGGAGW
jgi:hypothetical protein